MAQLRPALVCALGVLLLMPQAAAGGGWWSNIDVDRSTAAPGQRIEVNTEVLFRSAAAAEEAQETGGFYVYLLRDFDYSVVERAIRKRSPRNWWSLGGAEAIRVAPVIVTVSSYNLARATAAFTLPELPPARYHLMLCDATCVEPLGDVIPAEGLTVVGDPATAQIVERVDRVERRIRNQARQLAAARTNADQAQATAQNARSEAEQLATRVSAVAEDGRSSRVPSWAYGGWLVTGVLVGALALVVLRTRRSRSPRPARVPGSHPSEEELRELLSSEPVRPR